MPTVRDGKPGAGRWGRQTHNQTICLNIKSQIRDADAEWGEGNTLGVFGMSQEGRAVACLPKDTGQRDGLNPVFLEATWHRSDLLISALPGSCPSRGDADVRNDKWGPHTEFQDTRPAAPSCCPRDRPGLNGWQGMPSFTRPWAGTPARATGWLFSSCGGLPGSLSDSQEAADQPGEEGCGPGPAWGSSLGCPTCQILWDAQGGASFHVDGHVCFPEHGKVP